MFVLHLQQKVLAVAMCEESHAVDISGLTKDT